MQNKKAHILVVEDNEGDIVLIKECLEESEIIAKLTVATDGKMALDMLLGIEDYSEPSMPDLVLLDINLPIKNGHEVLKTIKENPTLKHIPVIIFTTSSSKSDILDSYQAHANCYLTKPIDMQEYSGTLRSVEDFWFKLAHLPT